MSETVGEVSETRGEIEIEWRITNFSELLQSDKEDAFRKSPEFNFFGASWYLVMKIFPESNRSSIEWIGLYIMRVNSGPSMTMTYTLGLKIADGQKERLFGGTADFDKYTGRGTPKFLLTSDLLDRESEVTPYDILTITCCLKRRDFNTVARTEKLSEDLLELMTSADDSNVMINVKGVKHAAHRNILAARTPVFASMFKHEMTEKTTGVVDIDDCEEDTFRTFLKYVYTGTVENLACENLVALYEVADKYQVDELKTDCLECMKNVLSVDMFCDIFTLAMRHNERELMKLATEFFAVNMEDIMETMKWETFLEENPKEANELLVKNHDNKKS